MFWLQGIVDIKKMSNTVQILTSLPQNVLDYLLLKENEHLMIGIARNIFFVE